MSSYNYTDTPNLNLVCCICRSPFIEPCTTRTCCHTFCYDCIAQAIAVNHQCPIDRTLLSLHDLIPADPVIRNLVDELSVRCPQEHLGCTHTCQRLLLPVHISDSCQYIEVPCPDARCAERVLKKDVKQHKCADDSSEARRKSVSDDDLQQKDSDRTGTSTGATASSEPSVDLAAENAMLRLRLSALESVVHTLRNEMFAVKHALGPWYQPDVQPQIREGPSEDLEASEAFERQLAEELAAQPAPAATGGRRRLHGRTSRPTSRPRRKARHRRLLASGSSYLPNYSFQASGQTPGLSYSQGASFPVTSPAAISIPPLDPTTPLPDTLASLHSTLGTLAGALGALAAARGAESLRTTEELRGLRGAMHGLRMQVHDMLTSRTHLAGASGSPGASTHGDTADAAPFNVNVPGWFGHGPRAYGIGPLHHPPPFGVPPVPPPTNITKL
ncbi:hypothetical protein C8Q80DRAFT_1272400 [Daedaleopsis nitida]|nr:hypothetical protein C8Q80DRAFT_1272400 [Daedaleopsis nitida]